MNPDDRPAAERTGREEYYMNLAVAVRERANCLGTRVGAVLVLDDRVIATGYNGTPMNMKNCDEGGCERCANREKFSSGTAYDICICVHAEQNTLLTAARFGIRVEGAVLYTTSRPCFGCTKELLQAGISRVYYLHEWSPPEDLKAQYEIIQARVPDGIRKLDMIDGRAEWAVGKKQILPSGSGHLAERRSEETSTDNPE